MSLMSCLEQLVAMTNLVPTPAAPPIFMLLFAISLAYSIKPCGYCLSLIGIMYLSLSPSSPFVSPLPASLAPNTTSTPPSFSDALPDRGWLNWNRGRIFDPVLVGYQPVPSSDTTTTAASASQCTNTVAGSLNDSEDVSCAETIVAPRGELPWGYFDLRYRGIGIVLDLGWRRTEEGMRWEGETGQMEVETEKTSDAELPEVEGELDSSATIANAETEWPTESVELVNEVGISKELESAEEKKPSSRWRWPSFAGDL